MKLFFLLLGTVSAYVPSDASSASSTTSAIVPGWLYNTRATKDNGCGGSFMNSLRVKSVRSAQSYAQFDEEELQKINVFPVCGGTFMNSLGALTDENVPLHQEEWVSPETLLPDTVVRQQSTPLLDRYKHQYQISLSRQQALAEEMAVAASSSSTSTPDQAKKFEEESVKSVSLEKKKPAPKRKELAKKKPMNVGAKAVQKVVKPAIPTTRPLTPDQPSDKWKEEEEIKSIHLPREDSKAASKVDKITAAAVSTKPLTPDQDNDWTEEQDN